MARKRTPEQLADDNERTTPIGFFLNAEAYWNSANILYRSNKRRKRSLPFGEKPSYYCYYHAIELYLKAVLRCHHGVDELQNKYGHRSSLLMNRAKELGVHFDDEDVYVLTIMSDTDAIIRSRYTRTGSFIWPTLEALNRTCKSLRVSSHEALRKAGVGVRPLRPAPLGRRPKLRARRLPGFPDGFEVG